MNRKSFKVNQNNFRLFCQSSWHSNMANVTYCWQIYESSGSLEKLLPFEKDDSQNESSMYSHLRHGSHRMCPVFDEFIRAVGGPPITCFSVCETPQSTVVLVQWLKQITYYSSNYLLARFIQNKMYHSYIHLLYIMNHKKWDYWAMKTNIPSLYCLFWFMKDIPGKCLIF